MPDDGVVLCRVFTPTGLELCAVHQPRCGTTDALLEAVAAAACLVAGEGRAWDLVLGSDVLKDPSALPLHSAGESETLRAVHRHGDVSHAKRAAERLSHCSAQVRRGALAELAILGDISAAVAPALVASLQDPDPSMCALVVELLDSLGRSAKSLAVPPLEGLVDCTKRMISSELLYDDLNDIPDCESTEDDGISLLLLRDTAIDALQRLSKSQGAPHRHALQEVGNHM